MRPTHHPIRASRSGSPPFSPAARAPTSAVLPAPSIGRSRRSLPAPSTSAHRLVPVDPGTGDHRPPPPGRSPRRPDQGLDPVRLRRSRPDRAGAGSHRCGARADPCRRRVARAPEARPPGGADRGAASTAGHRQARAAPAPRARAHPLGLERLVLPICRLAGVDRPRVNLPIAVPGRPKPLIVDFAWPELRMVVEADSQRFHGDWSGPRSTGSAINCWRWWVAKPSVRPSSTGRGSGRLGRATAAADRGSPGGASAVRVSG